MEYHFNRRGLEANTPLLKELVTLRAELAAVLGYEKCVGGGPGVAG